MIYLDNGATTKPETEVLNSYRRVSEEFYANPSAIHDFGAIVSNLQRRAREQIATLLSVSPSEVVFTSGGTEGNNLAIKGIALQHQGRGKHIITTEVEHPSVYQACQSLEQLGFQITYLKVDIDGKININELRKAIREDTILISVMHVNNEIGTIQPIKEIGQIVKHYPKLFFHVDAVQSLGKIPLHVKEANVDLCTFSGHKINGVKGTGVLYVKEGTTLFPLFHGGSQEFGHRSGTEHVAGNVSFAQALRLIKEKERSTGNKLLSLRHYLIDELISMDEVTVNSPNDGAPHIINISVPSLKSEVIIHALYEKNIIISTQSACSSKKNEPSRVLIACGRSLEIAKSGLRISLSYETDEEQLKIFIKVFKEIIKQLKGVLE